MSEWLIQVVRSVYSDNSSLRSYGEFSLNRIAEGYPTFVLTEIRTVLENSQVLNASLLNCIKILISRTFRSNQNEIKSILKSIDRICCSLNDVSCCNEVAAVAVEVFAKSKEFMNDLDLKILPLLVPSKCNEDIVLNSTDSVFARYAKGVYLVFISSTNIQWNNKEKMIKVFLEDFVKRPDIGIAEPFANLVRFVEESEKQRYFLKFVDVLREKPNQITANLLRAADSLTNYTAKETDTLFNMLVPCLSAGKLDDAVVESLYAISKNCDIYSFLMQRMCVSKVEKERIGGLECLLKLIKIGMSYDASLALLFDDVRVPTEAVILCELVIITNYVSSLPMSNCISFLEKCWSFEIGKPAIEIASLLGKNEKADMLVLERLSRAKDLSYGPLYMSIVDSWLLNHPSCVLSEQLAVYVALFLANNSEKHQYPSIRDKVPDVDDFIAKVEGDTTCVFLHKLFVQFKSTSILRALCRFVLKLIPKCSKAVFDKNLQNCVSFLKGDIKHDTDLLCDILAACVDIDCQRTTRIMSGMLGSLSRGWLFFGSATSNAVNINIVFDTLSRVHVNASEFLLFASQHLPNPKEANLCRKVIHVLSQKFRESSISNELPPKCQLMEFVANSKVAHDEDFYVCLGSLVAMPPVNTDDFKLLADILLASQRLGRGEAFLIESGLLACHSPNDLICFMAPIVPRCLVDKYNYHILMLILLFVAGIGIDEDADLIALDFIPSRLAILQRFRGCDCSSLFVFLAKLCGGFIPLFSQTYVGVRCIVSIVNQLASKTYDVEERSFQGLVKIIGSTFSADCLEHIGNGLCMNITMESVTAFHVLFDLREGELFNMLQSFASKVVNSDRHRQISMIFGTNETIAKAAVACVTPENFHKVRLHVLESKYVHSLIEIMKERPVELADCLRSILDDSRFCNLLNMDKPMSRFIMTLTEPVSEHFETDTWNLSEKISFISILDKHLDKVAKDQQANFVSDLAAFEDTECVTKVIQVLDRHLPEDDWLERLAPRPPFVPALVDLRSGNLEKIVSMALSNCESLPFVVPVLPQVIYQLLSHKELIGLLMNQHAIDALQPYVLIFISAFLCSDTSIDEAISNLLSKVCDVQIKTPEDFIDILELFERINPSDPSGEVLDILLERLEYDDIRACVSLVVLSALFKSTIVDKAIMGRAAEKIDAFIKTPSEQKQAAALVCMSCCSF